MEQRQLVLSFIDLANAYGSVRHNLIQFALWWYHVDPLIIELVLDYYEKLQAKIQTNFWSTQFFLFEIGLFQGCVHSTILFDCVFQLLLDMLKPLDHLGYSFKGVNEPQLLRAYSDDLSLATATPKGNQLALNTTQRFLDWTKTMRAKPKKCISMGWRQFDNRTDSGEYTKYNTTVYSAFDPLLTIAGEAIKFVVDPSNKSHPLSADHFKFLGRWLAVSSEEGDVKKHVRRCFLRDIALVDKCGANGLMKLWLYPHYILARLAWPFIVHDFNYYFAVDLSNVVASSLKRWAGLYASADLGCLFRSRANFGLQLSSVSTHFTKMQVIKSHLLENSVDPIVQAIYSRQC